MMKNKSGKTIKIIKITVVITFVLFMIVSSFFFNWQDIMMISRIYAPVGKDLNVIFVDVGKADSALINADGYNVLIDAGISLDAEEISIVLDRYNIKTLDMVIISHGDTDHIGGMKTLANNYDIKECVINKDDISLKENSGVFRNMFSALEDNDVKITYASANDSFTFEKLRLDIISPDHNYNDSNDNSLVVKATYGDTDLLFTGDISENVEKNLLKNESISECDVLKVSHHGSRTATTKAFLNKVKPEIAVVSVGYNTNNLPNVETINRLKSYKDIKLYRTDKNGNVAVYSDGNKITVSTEK